VIIWSWLDLFDQLHLRPVRRLDKGDMAAVVVLLPHDVRAVAAELGDRAVVVVGLYRDVLDPHHLLAVLRRGDRRDVELQPVQVELDIAVGGLVRHRRTEIVDVELRRLLGIVRLDMDVPDFHGHARLLRLGWLRVADAALGRSLAAWRAELNREMAVWDPRGSDDRGARLGEFLYRDHPKR